MLFLFQRHPFQQTNKQKKSQLFFICGKIAHGKSLHSCKTGIERVKNEPDSIPKAVQITVSDFNELS